MRVLGYVLSTTYRGRERRIMAHEIKEERRRKQHDYPGNGETAERAALCAACELAYKNGCPQVPPKPESWRHRLGVQIIGGLIVIALGLLTAQVRSLIDRTLTAQELTAFRSHIADGMTKDEKLAHTLEQFQARIEVHFADFDARLTDQGKILTLLADDRLRRQARQP
jgi:hypothetical protein